LPALPSSSGAKAGPSPAIQASTPSTPTHSPPSPSGFCLKLQKLENWKNRSIEELLGEAQKIYVRRKGEKQKQKSKIMLSMIQQVNREKPNHILLDLNRPSLPHGV
jgi:hypothetical protein